MSHFLKKISWKKSSSIIFHSLKKAAENKVPELKKQKVLLPILQHFLARFG
jgi:hypothetical protein